MEIRHLRYFIAVAEELNFSRAAERLNIAQPPLSQQIQALEAELRLQLFERNKRPLRLTAAGKVFLEQARLVLITLEQAVISALDILTDVERR
ncbi:LysR family transcriptional regulator [Anabaena azotica FACHB-119]|uniref:LysR family transcriptional regulator n=1 Tax=Anabaena azotica FACHB-119 TaxID=947527 RepID=A0ABR8D1U0_9NOST|nr:LysR family transcriptional regulator [Anabaena azotica FACHB-119]